MNESQQYPDLSKLLMSDRATTAAEWLLTQREEWRGRIALGIYKCVEEDLPISTDIIQPITRYVLFGDPFIDMFYKIIIESNYDEVLSFVREICEPYDLYRREDEGVIIVYVAESDETTKEQLLKADDIEGVWGVFSYDWPDWDYSGPIYP